MKPKPFWALNHLTVPIDIAFLLRRMLPPDDLSGGSWLDRDEVGARCEAGERSTPIEPTTRDMALYRRYCNRLQPRASVKRTSLLRLSSHRTRRQQFTLCPRPRRLARRKAGMVR